MYLFCLLLYNHSFRLLLLNSFGNPRTGMYLYEIYLQFQKAALHFPVFVGCRYIYVYICIYMLYICIFIYIYVHVYIPYSDQP